MRNLDELNLTPEQREAVEAYGDNLFHLGHIDAMTEEIHRTLQGMVEDSRAFQAEREAYKALPWWKKIWRN